MSIKTTFIYEWILYELGNCTNMCKFKIAELEPCDYVGCLNDLIYWSSVWSALLQCTVILKSLCNNVCFEYVPV
jgi:hypothetical protein